MKTFLIIITVLICFNSNAQKNKYYDLNWKPSSVANARFYSKIIKADSGWYRQDYFFANNTLQMTGLFEDQDCLIENGYFKFYYLGGIPESMGRYVHGKKEGLWLHFYPYGVMKDSTEYLNGKPAGTALKWYQNGYLADSTVYNKDGNALEIQWDSKGNLSGAGRLKDGKLNGPWQFFYDNGRLAARESYDTGKLLSREYYDKEGNLEDTASKDRMAMFPGGLNAWGKFIANSIGDPNTNDVNTAYHITMILSATIDEDGNIIEPFIRVPYDNNFDKKALQIFYESPKWLPAIKHNRPVVSLVSQPVSFEVR